jgi:hypothetical protein
MTEITLPVVYRRSIQKMLFLFLGSLLFVAGGFLLLHKDPFTGYACVAFFGACALVSAISLHPKASYLELTEQGFTTCSLFRRSFTPWASVKEFFPIRIQLNSMVGLNYSSQFNRLETARRFSTALAGAEGALPDTYGMGAEQLSALLNNLLARRLG